MYFKENDLVFEGSYGLDIALGYRYYQSNEVANDQNSGAYIFRTKGLNEKSTNWRDILDVKTYSGKVINITSIVGSTVDTRFVSKNNGKNQ